MHLYYCYIKKIDIRGLLIFISNIFPFKTILSQISFICDFTIVNTHFNSNIHFTFHKINYVFNFNEIFNAFLGCYINVHFNKNLLSINKIHNL